ncbi:MAG TPA: hypothetical protein VFL93_01285 [Longimicrobiaceae bacterium]|nr:hypothetical protein [Longimicrobiaceae bacterium]
MRTISVVLALLLWSAPRLAAQVAVAPLIVVLDDHAPWGTFMVVNRSQTPQAVTLGLRFGYPAPDSLGEQVMVYDSSHVEWSAAPWMRVFPRRLILPPGEQQTVRLIAHPPASLADGEYWTRLVTTSAPVNPPSVPTNVEGVTARVNFRLKQITTVLFRKGAASTSVSIGAVRAQADSAVLHVLVPMTRHGNAPFFGRTTLRVLDASGRSVAESTEQMDVYFGRLQRFSIDASKLPPGRYVAEVTVASERADIPREELLHAEPVVRRVPFTISAAGPG